MVGGGGVLCCCGGGRVGGFVRGGGVGYVGRCVVCGAHDGSLLPG